MVLSAPLLKLYGSGHRRIMMRSLMPSCLRVRASAAKRESFATSRETYEWRRFRETMNAAVDPTIVEDATMNQLYVVSKKCFKWPLLGPGCKAHPFGNPYTKPAKVTHDEYPSNGGKDTMKVKTHSIRNPPGIDRHDFANPARKSNIFSLKTSPRMVRRNEMVPARIRPARCRGVSRE
jgi:hypothetical protein